jgi:hypothetical protein
VIQTSWALLGGTHVHARTPFFSASNVVRREGWEAARGQKGVVSAEVKGVVGAPTFSAFFGLTEVGYVLMIVLG